MQLLVLDQMKKPVEVQVSIYLYFCLIKNKQHIFEHIYKQHTYITIRRDVKVNRLTMAGTIIAEN